MATQEGPLGLVQAGRTWNEKLGAHIEAEGPAATATDPVIYVKGSWTSNDFAAAGFSVEDYIAIGSRRELVGSLAWLALGTRLDISFAASTLARFGHKPGRIHWDAAKRIPCYLKGTKAWRLKLGGKAPEVAPGTDADSGSHRDNRRSIGAYIIRTGTGAVSWRSKKRSCVAFSRSPYLALNTSICPMVPVYSGVGYLGSACREGVCWEYLRCVEPQTTYVNAW
jgi:hypothetical protein